MKNVWSFIRHNSGIVIASTLCGIVLTWSFACQSKVVSIHNPPALVTRAMLEVEVDHFLRLAEIRFIDLDQQDEFKRTIFAFAMNFMKEGRIDPISIALTLGNLIGIGAVIDNVRKRTLICALKGVQANDKKKKDTS